MKVTFKGLLNGNMLKIIAAVFMVADHIGVSFAYLIGHEWYIVCRSLGRIAMPLFAFFIAEGCRYTRDRKKYFLMIFLLGLICNAAFYVVMNDVYFCILTTFSLSILLIYCYDEFLSALKSDEKAFSKLISAGYAAAKFALIVILALFIADLTKRTDGTFDYGLPGVFLPLLCYPIKNRWLRLIPFAAGITWSVLSSPFPSPIPYFAFIAVIFVALYNGERGKLNLKYFFYIFYPAHILVIEGIYLLLNI
ncbi:MAG: conjugal transfer protein TraX [Christensenellaceae bacterium]|nr:conjugal transfer protein TraX [Christensenellaceae bacterium]MDY2851615.1 TraX family protein [Christensenellaceae bacterium]